MPPHPSSSERRSTTSNLRRSWVASVRPDLRKPFRISVSCGGHSYAVNESRRSGFIDEDTWGSLSVILAEADPEGRNDLGRCDEEIDAVAQALAWVRSQAQITFDEEFAQKRLEVGAVEEQAAVITRLANAGDLATARDVMARAEAGDEPLTVTPTGKHVGTFFPRVLEGLAKGLNRDDVDLLEAEGEVADVSLVELSPGDREIAVRGLHAWVEMKAHSNLRPSLVSLAPTLRLIGIEADGEGTTHLAGGPDRRWIDLAGVRRTGRALVPAFGSTSGDRLRMLCCWVTPMIDDAGSDRPGLIGAAGCSSLLWIAFGRTASHSGGRTSFAFVSPSHRCRRCRIAISCGARRAPL